LKRAAIKLQKTRPAFQLSSTLLSILYNGVCAPISKGKIQVRQTGKYFLVGVLVLVVRIGVFHPDPSSAQQDEAFEQSIYEELTLLNPAAVPVFKEASDAYFEQDWEAAEVGFKKVLELVPEFPDADRRMAYLSIQTDRPAEALRYAKRAFENAPTPHNEAIVAFAMLVSGDGFSSDMIRHARIPAQIETEDFVIQSILLSVGVATENQTAITEACLRLMRIAPDFAPGFYFGGLMAAYEDNFEEAVVLLNKAQELGYPAEEVQAALEGVRSLEKDILRSGMPVRIGLYGLGGWIGGLAVLLLLGMLLSRLTLSAVDRYQSASQTQIGSGERRLRSVYRAVIAITSLSFYVSIPLLIISVIIIAGAVIYAMLVLRYIPIKLLLIVAGIAIYTLIAVVRSLFARFADADPGRLLAREEAPKLWALTDEVANKMETRPVESIYLTPGTDIAVMERGGIQKKLQGKGQRCLILGLGILPNMPQSQFKAILGHEYGHFVNKDTAGGNLANQVRLSIHHMGFGLVANGLNNWYNPAWWFVNGFYRIFLRVTLGASRLQEILADRYAAMAYGARDFADGLKHVIHQSLVFDMQMDREVEKMEGTDHRLRNVYTLLPIEEDDKKEALEEVFQNALTHQTSAYDSHPAPETRFALVEKCGAPDVTESTPGLVWDLFEDLSALQHEMTQQIQTNIDEYKEMVKEQKLAMEAQQEG